MARKNNRVVLGVVVVIGALVYFGFAGFQEGKAYYKTIEELHDMGDAAHDKRIRVAGTVSAGSIERDGTEITFRLEQNQLTLPVRYTGSSPVPDTFQDGAEALCDGKYLPDGTFDAKLIQAKCASKYEAEYGTKEAGQ
ncbi:MAG: cytochrome c maturation protein CcmE [Candidatus Krumholzibacteria bacterium]|nr:cytochrome c maturation protein CcmE [Candidatus Krumholzibacteria bacterium]